MSATLSCTTKVYQVREGRNWTTVVAVPAKQTEKIGKVAFPELREQLLRPKYVFSEQAPDEAIVELICIQQEFPPIDRAPWESNLGAAKFENFYLRKLPLFAGRCIVAYDSGDSKKDYEKGMRAYGKGLLPEAYDFFVSAAEKSWTFDVLNMAGNVARRIGKNDEAVAFLLYAAQLEPENRSRGYIWHLSHNKKGIASFVNPAARKRRREIRTSGLPSKLQFFERELGIRLRRNNFRERLPVQNAYLKSVFNFAFRFVVENFFDDLNCGATKLHFYDYLKKTFLRESVRVEG